MKPSSYDKEVFIASLIFSFCFQQAVSNATKLVNKFILRDTRARNASKSRPMSARGLAPSPFKH